MPNEYKNRMQNDFHTVNEAQKPLCIWINL